jgi:exodeoxyribonuclease VII large subunit
MHMVQKQRKVYTVQQINALIKITLEQNLPPRLTVTGQIGDWKRQSSGHCYFSLKDDSGLLGCVMWASKAKKLKFAPENGIAALATGHIDLYSPQGRLQFYVDTLAPAGIGDLQLAFEQMYKRLKAQGLFSDDHKKPIPSYPMRIGIVTSPTGAAVLDIADSIYNRWPCAKLFISPVPVQGPGAAEKIASAIRNINAGNKRLDLDVLIVGRGGGSQEDLWQFNEEVVARAIFDSRIPIISAVGHEIDTTIADLVADARASTPTKAGVIAVPDMNDVLGRIGGLQKQLSLSAHSNLNLSAQRLETIRTESLFKYPRRLIDIARQRADQADAELTGSIKDRLTDLAGRLEKPFQTLLSAEPSKVLEQQKGRLNNLDNTAKSAVKAVFTRKQLQLTAIDNRFRALNPRAVLGRGYSITVSKTTGRVITDSGNVKIGDMLITELAGQKIIESKVEKKLDRGKG